MAFRPVRLSPVAVSVVAMIELIRSKVRLDRTSVPPNPFAPTLLSVASIPSRAGVSNSEKSSTSAPPFPPSMTPRSVTAAAMMKRSFSVPPVRFATLLYVKKPPTSPDSLPFTFQSTDSFGPISSSVPVPPFTTAVAFVPFRQVLRSNVVSLSPPVILAVSPASAVSVTVPNGVTPSTSETVLLVSVNWSRFVLTFRVSARSPASRVRTVRPPAELR